MICIVADLCLIFTFSNLATVSSNDGETWVEVDSGLINAKIYALTVSNEGKIYAGTTKGKIFSSVDQGVTWQQVTWQPPGGLAALLAWFLPRPLRLPTSVVRVLTTYSERQTTCLVAGMAEGIYVSKNGGLTWKQRHPAASDPAAKHKGGAWTFAAPEPGEKPFVGMDTGVFPPSSVCRTHRNGRAGSLAAYRPVDSRRGKCWYP